MKKLLIISFLISLILQNIACAEAPLGDIGANIVKDPYNKKVFVVKILQNSTAQQFGLPEGAQIISINDQKVKKLNLEQITNLLQGEIDTKVKLVIKYNKKESILEIPRAQLIAPKKADDKFEIHWKQVVPINANLDPIPTNMEKSMSKSWHSEVVYFKNYWTSRKAEFKNGYDGCMSYPQNEQNSCLMNLTNREINKTAQDKQLRIQENILRQQTIQNSMNNLNQMQINNNLYNINNRLREMDYRLH